MWRDSASLLLNNVHMWRSHFLQNCKICPMLRQSDQEFKVEDRWWFLKRGGGKILFVANGGNFKWVVLHRKDHLICSVITFIRFIHDGEWILIQKVRQIIKHCIIYYIMRNQDIYLYFCGLKDQYVKYLTCSTKN